MIEKYNVTPLFGIPLYQSYVEGVVQQDLEYIKSLNYVRYPSGDGYGTQDKFLLDNPKLSKLKNSILKNCDHYLYDVLGVDKSIKFEITNSWSNLHKKGDTSGSHTHRNSMISGVFYVQTDESSGEIMFHNEKTNYNIFTPTVNVPFNNSNLNIFNAEGWAIKPKNNMLILFPSTLKHSVFENKSFQDRYSVAFNMFAFGKFGFDNVTQLGLDNSTNA